MKVQIIQKESGGYLELTRSNVDFSNGFSFEIYGKLSRLAYDNGKGQGSSRASFGLFCRTPSLNYGSYTQALRFGFATGGENTICKFNNASSWSGTGNNLTTLAGGGVTSIGSNIGYTTNKDFYLTVVYTVNGAGSQDKIEYYIDGKLFGETYYGSDSYTNGLKTWNSDSCPFFVGVCPWWSSGNLYFMKGSVYTCRLYTCSMTKEQVEENMSMTQKYRASF